MLDIALGGFVLLLLGMGLRRPYMWVLAYLYVDILSPQKISWFLLAKVPLSLIVFVAAFAGWLIADDKRDSRFTGRQVLLLLLLVYCGLTTLSADFPEAALEKWSWAWKALFFAMFLPLTLRTRMSNLVTNGVYKERKEFDRSPPTHADMTRWDWTRYGVLPLRLHHWRPQNT